MGFVDRPQICIRDTDRRIDCHARVGGATGTKLNSADCPAIKNGIDPNCQGASMLMHVTKTASGYFENMWLWVADHDIEYDPDHLYQLVAH
jgi:hypothetical protein